MLGPVTSCTNMSRHVRTRPERYPNCLDESRPVATCPDMSVLFQKMCTNISRLLPTCSDMSKYVQTCPGLSRPVPNCPVLSRPVPICTVLPEQPVPTCPHRNRSDLTSPDMLEPVTTFSNLSSLHPTFPYLSRPDSNDLTRHVRTGPDFFRSVPTYPDRSSHVPTCVHFSTPADTA